MIWQSSLSSGEANFTHASVWQRKSTYCKRFPSDRITSPALFLALCLLHNTVWPVFPYFFSPQPHDDSLNVPSLPLSPLPLFMKITWDQYTLCMCTRQGHVLSRVINTPSVCLQEVIDREALYSPQRKETLWVWMTLLDLQKKMSFDFRAERKTPR